METNAKDGAQAELDQIDRSYLADISMNFSSIDKRRWKVVMPDGTKRGFHAHWNKRRKAIRDWLRKWGPSLKRIGYRVAAAHGTNMVLGMTGARASDRAPNQIYRTLWLEEEAKSLKWKQEAFDNEVAIYFIEEIEAPIDDDDAAAQLEKENLKIFPILKHRRASV